jgi:hypothetical protein
VGLDLNKFWKLEEHKLGEATFTHFADGTAHKNRMQGNYVHARDHLLKLPRRTRTGSPPDLDAQHHPDHGASANFCQHVQWHYNGTFKGSITVSKGQNCMFVVGGITGNVTVNGGSLALANAKVTGNASVRGGSAFAIGQASEITGYLQIQNVASGSVTNQICGAKLDGNVLVSTNATPIQIGSSDVSGPGSSLGGNLTINGNTAVTTVYNNTVAKNLSCARNTSITGGGNSAEKLNGQCSTF